MKNQFTISKKVCMLGSFGVGKTSLVRRFVYNEFKEDYLSTIGVHIHKKTTPLTTDASSGINFILWDIAQIEKFNEVIKNYFRGSHGAIVIFDVTRVKTFRGTDIYLKPFLDMNPNCRLILVANKIDLVERELIVMEQLLHLSKAYHAPFVMTSAKTGENVEEVFTKLGNLLVKAD